MVFPSSILGFSWRPAFFLWGRRFLIIGADIPCDQLLPQTMELREMVTSVTTTRWFGITPSQRTL
jgi:hypothetical protein